jgi:hypothetical protein
MPRGAYSRAAYLTRTLATPFAQACPIAGAP